MSQSVLGERDIRSINRAVARTWSDSSFRDYFLNKPREVLTELGIVLSENLNIIAAPGSDSCNVVSFQGNSLSITLPGIPKDVDDAILDPQGIDVSFSLKICCTCLEADTKER